jgi:hypothetical protein
LTKNLKKPTARTAVTWSSTIPTTYSSHDTPPAACPLSPVPAACFSASGLLFRRRFGLP